MTEMKRLIDEPGSPAALLLGSAEGDGPSSPREAEARALRSAERALPAAASSAVIGRRGNAFGHVLRVGSWGLLAAVAIFTIVVTVRSASSSAGDEQAVTDVAKSANLAGAPSAASPHAADPREGQRLGAANFEGVHVEDLPTATPNRDDGPAGSGLRDRRPPAAPSPSSRITDELAVIDAARAALASKHPDAALGRVHAYQERFPDGRYAEEADALEIQALAALGRRHEARAKAKRFLAVRPGSPYEHRVLPSATSAEVDP